MFIANLMAGVLALAMVGASTASVSKVENNSFGSDVVLNRDLHKGYYDPAETYGNTNMKLYNYTSYYLFQTTGYDDDYSWFGSDEHAEPDGNCSLFWSSNELGFGVSSQQRTSFALYDGVPPTSSYDPTKVFTGDIDFYWNGEFLCTKSTDDPDYFLDYETGSLISYSISNLEITANQTGYLWIFDHQEAEPYTPVDLLGDIAEGMTGGIVPVAEGIGSGLQSLVQNIFLNADHDGLSVFGIVIICFAGLALALGLSRWVLNFVDTLGARDR